jgi:hypothetical protein
MKQRLMRIIERVERMHGDPSIKADVLEDLNYLLSICPD